MFCRHTPCRVLDSTLSLTVDVKDVCDFESFFIKKLKVIKHEKCEKL